MSYLVKIMYLLRKINQEKSRETLFSDAKPYLIKELSSSKADKIIASSNYSEGVQLLKKMEFNDDTEQINWIRSSQQRPKNTNLRKLYPSQFNKFRNVNHNYEGNRQISIGCYKCGNKSHKAVNCNQKKCFICKKDNHDEKNCFFNPNKKYCHFHRTKMHDNAECRAQIRSSHGKIPNINNIDMAENIAFPEVDVASDNNQFTGWVSQDLIGSESEN